MKKALLGLVLCLLIVTAGFSMGFSLKLKGGAAYIGGGDYNSAIQGTNDEYAASYSSVSGTFSKLSLGMDLGAEFILDINENFGIGLGVDYMSFSRNAQVATGNWTFIIFPITDTDSIEPNISTIPVTLNLHYKVPAGPVKFDLFAGVGYYISKVKIHRIMTTTFLALGSDIDFSANKGAFGFQGGVGIDIPIGGNISFIVDVTGRYARLSDIEGDYTQINTIFGVVQPATTGSDYYFWADKYTYNGTAYQMFNLSKNGPSGAAYSDVRHGNFDFSGVSGQAGIKINF